MSSKANIGVVIGVDNSELAKGFKDALTKANKLGSDMEGVIDQQTSALMQQLGKVERSSSLKSTARQMENLVGMMHEFGMVGTASFNQVVKQAGALKDSAKDVSAMIDANTTLLPWKGIASAAQGAAGAFSMAQGAMSLFGVEGEVASETMVKLQAAMALTQGLDSIEQLQESFVILGQLIKANPIFFIATALVAVGVAVYALTSQLSDAEKAQIAVNNAMEAGANNAQKDITHLQRLINVSRDTNLTLHDRKRAYAEIQNEYPDYFKSLSYEEFLTKKGSEATKGAINQLKIKSQLMAIESQLVEEQIKLNKINAEGITTGDKVSDAINQGLQAITMYSGGKNAFKERLNESKNAINELLVAQSKLTKSTGETGIDFKSPTGSIEPKSTGKAGKSAPKINTALESELAANKKIYANYYTELQNMVLEGSLNKQALGAAEKGALLMQLEQELAILTKHKQSTEALEKSILALKVELYNQDTIAFKANIEEKGLAMQAQSEETTAFVVDLQSVARQNMASMVDDFATSLGVLMTSGGDFADTFSQLILTGFAQLLKGLGNAMVVAGIGKLKFDAMMVQFGGGAGAIAAGAGLVLAAGAMQAMKKPVKLADGGVIRGDTFAMLGEYPQANMDPEVAIRSSHLRKVVSEESGGGMGGDVNFIIRGKDLQGVLKRAENEKTRR